LVEQEGSVRPCAPESPDDTMMEIPREVAASRPALVVFT
jgi:hypothetical protein